MRQRVPCHTIACEIKNGIEQYAATMFGFGTTRVTTRRQQALKGSLLLISKIAGIGLVAFHNHTLS